MVSHAFGPSRDPGIHGKSLRNHTCDFCAEKVRDFGHMVRKTPQLEVRFCGLLPSRTALFSDLGAFRLHFGAQVVLELHLKT